LRRQATVREDEIRRLEAEIDKLRLELEALSVYRQLAYHDDLTGLRNRRYFEERLAEELSRAARANLPCTLVVLDVNEFKAINDRYGHAAGDAVLRDVGHMLAANARAVDIACRIGGDEFAIILPMTDAGGAAAARMRFAAAQTGIEGPDGRPISLSFGSATYPDEETTAGGLLDRADGAMYAAKRKSKVDHAA
jgi:diguanylate cyclase (GGDEF)-like protein